LYGTASSRNFAINAAYLIDQLFMAGEWCAAASAMGVDLATFASTAAYGTHFITLEDLRSLDRKFH
jgi:hypothetical protein